MVGPGVDPIERTIRVEFRHRVFFTREVFSLENPLLLRVLAGEEPGRPVRAVVLIDRGVLRSRPGLAGQVAEWFGRHSGRLELAAPPQGIEGGEAAKNDPGQVLRVQALLDRSRIDRQSYVLAVGGGAFLDMVGLAAATAHRGVRLVRLPTTTLGQNDSGVGIKNGVNAFGKKNFVGTFAPPHAVIDDFGFLETLPEREKRAGFSEAVKVALIRSRPFFEALEERAPELDALEAPAVEWMVEECARIHVDHIATSGDPFETGSARPLDFGHWAAHKLEQLSDYRIRHGEAVAAGVALDTVYSGLAGLLAPGKAERALRLLQSLGLPVHFPEMRREDPRGRLLLLEGLEEFREHLGGELTVTLLEDLGRSVEVHAMDPSLVAEAIGRLGSLARPLAGAQPAGAP